jgi:flavin reductase (DIM6/NTAB) family NADH-FMN oxidoreductase RutF
MYMKPKTVKNRRPWNRVSQQIYSLSTVGANGKINMNIVSYATAATLKPKSYVIAVYRGTKTHANIFDKSANEYFLLQALSQPQSRYVRPLGQKSGLRYDKAKYLAKQNISFYNLEGSDYGYLPDCGFVIACKITSKIVYGDHDLITAEVVKTVEDNSAAQLLTTLDLIDQGIIL